MKVISLINSKGGVGKTTLAINLAAYLYNCISVNKDIRILLVDADPQGSIRDWKEAQNKDSDFDVIAADRKNTLLDVPSIIQAGSYQYTIIDTPGKLGDITAAAITISDLCLIPVCPSPYDLWATSDIVELLQTRHQLTNGRPDAAYIINKAINRTNISRSVQAYLETCPFQVVGKPIVQRVSYAESARRGSTVFDTFDALAVEEMKVLGDEVVKLLGVKSDI